jgi:hypothetical protein
MLLVFEIVRLDVAMDASSAGYKIEPKVLSNCRVYIRTCAKWREVIIFKE